MVLFSGQNGLSKYILDLTPVSNSEMWIRTQIKLPPDLGDGKKQLVIRPGIFLITHNSFIFFATKQHISVVKEED